MACERSAITRDHAIDDFALTFRDVHSTALSAKTAPHNQSATTSVINYQLYSKQRTSSKIQSDYCIILGVRQRSPTKNLQVILIAPSTPCNAIASAPITYIDYIAPHI